MGDVIIKNNLYQLENESITIGGATFNYPIVKPAGGASSALIDILKNYKWKNDGSVSEVPYVTLTEYTLTYGMWTSNLLTLFNNINVAVGSGKTGGVDPYGALYAGRTTGFTYAFPYLIKPNNSVLGGGVGNTWTEINPISDMLNSIPVVGGEAAKGWGEANKAAALVGNFSTPGYGAEKIFNYSSTKQRRVVISFPLYNTLNVKSAIDNFNFVNLFALQNLKTRTTYLSYIPPKLYNVDSFSMGGLYMPVAYVANFDAFSIGTTRRITDYDGAGLVAAGQDGILIPEAYKIEITLEELIPQSSNIMAGTLGGQKTQVIKDLKIEGSPVIGDVQSLVKTTSNLTQTLNAKTLDLDANGQQLYPLKIIPPNLK
jgi:hypothetical protein